MADTAKLKSWDELKKLRENINTEAEKTSDTTVIAVGMATCGVAAGADRIMDVLREELQKANVQQVELVSTGCFGFCYAEPMVEVREPGAVGVKYGFVNEEIARDIIRQHIIKGELLDKAIIGQEVQKP